MWVRCSRCQARRRLQRHPDQYDRLPRCGTPKCKTKPQRYYVDHYRQNVERNKGAKATLCRCTAYHFPHRAASGQCWQREITDPPEDTRYGP